MNNPRLKTPLTESNSIGEAARPNKLNPLLTLRENHAFTGPAF